MFSTEQERTPTTPRSWYGKPQHEAGDREFFEFERYGSPSHEQPRKPIEFLPAVEWPADIGRLSEGTIDTGSGSIRPTRVSD